MVVRATACRSRSILLMFFYQRDMFDEADLEYPPHVYGEPYLLDGEEVEWDMDAMWEVAKRLTVDVNGNTPNDADFDPPRSSSTATSPPSRTSARSALLRVR